MAKQKVFRRNVRQPPRLPPPKNHTRFDVLFARDIIDHSAQAIASSNLVIVKKAIAPEIVDIASRITATSSRRTDKLQALLVDWGFAPMTVGSAPPARASNLPIQPGEQPLASDVDFRRLTDAAEARAADVYLELMIKQHQFTISAARDQLHSGSHPAAMRRVAGMASQLCSFATPSAPMGRGGC